MKIFTLQAICILLAFTSIYTKAGAKLHLNQEVLRNASKKFIPEIIKRLQNLRLPDQGWGTKFGFINLSVNLNNLIFNLSHLPAENVKISLQDPNQLVINITGVQGNGGLQTHLKLGFVSDSFGVSYNLYWLNANIVLSTIMIPSTRVPGRNVISFKVERVDVDLDFDFDIHAPILGKVVGIIKGPIKDRLKGGIIPAFQNAIHTTGTEMMNKVIQSVDMFPTIQGDVSLDLSLTEVPIVQNGNLILSTIGGVVNFKKPETLNPPFPMPEDLPNQGNSGLQIQVIGSTYSVNTAIDTLAKSRMLEVTITPKDVNTGMIKLNTTSLGLVFHGLAKKYGAEKPCDFKIDVISVVDSQFKEGGLSTNINVAISLLVEGVAESVVDMKGVAAIDVALSVADQGKAKAHINSVKLTGLEVTKDLVDKLHPERIEGTLNLLLGAVIPMINKTKLDNLVIQIPTLDNITYSGSTLHFDPKFVEFGVNPVFQAGITIPLMIKLDTHSVARKPHFFNHNTTRRNNHFNNRAYHENTEKAHFTTPVNDYNSYIESRKSLRGNRNTLKYLNDDYGF